MNPIDDWMVVPIKPTREMPQAVGLVVKAPGGNPCPDNFYETIYSVMTAMGRKYDVNESAPAIRQGFEIAICQRDYVTRVLANPLITYGVIDGAIAATRADTRHGRVRHAQHIAGARPHGIPRIHR